ncbi:Laccase-1 [Escovopsis weberi]|uniref:Laccase-1 n=1 Tax=Escovopsis weberi TaxID=150374 RepID=A0A0M9VXB4_ESCWE|nr:Laccase-1 [Escovopsis weberi]
MTRLSSLLSLVTFASGALAAGQFRTSLCVTYEDGSPDGFTRPMFKVNGTSPGPWLQIDQGDDVEITVYNQSPDNITIHWHGIAQQGTPWSDGVPGATQRGIRPNDTFVYRFTATESGSYWYHSHFKAHIEDGLMGPLTIRPPADAPNPFNLIDDDCHIVQELVEAAQNPHNLIVTDWFHLPSDDILSMSDAAKFEDGCFDSFLFNGKGRVICQSPEELAKSATPIMQQALNTVKDQNLTLTDKGCVPPDAVNALFGVLGAAPGNTSLLKPEAFEGCTATDTDLEIIDVGLGDWVALELVSALNYASPIFAIDEHDLVVYAVDGHQITPQEVQAINIGNGDRYSIFINTHKEGDFRISITQISPFQLITGYAILRVRNLANVGGDPCDEGSDGKSSPSAPAANTTAPESSPWFDLAGNPLKDDITFYNFTLGTPFPPEPVSKDAYAMHKLEMIFVNDSVTWSLNGTAENMPALENRETPVLFDTPTANFEPGNSFSTLNDTWHDIVFTSHLDIAHMIHKHTYTFRVIGSGVGNFTWKSIADAVKDIPESFNLDNPPKRDTVFSIPATDPTTPGWLAIRFHSKNPGPFVLHCHIAPHMAKGMLMVIEEGIDKWPEVPAEYVLN